MKLSDILTMALGRVDETLEDIDDIALSIMRNAVNQAYIAIRSTVDRRVTVHTLEQAIVPVELPADCIEVVMITHSVEGEYSESEYYRNGDQLYFYGNVPNGKMTISYVQAPSLQTTGEPNTIEIDIKDIYSHAIITFAAYTYQLYRRKYASADILLKEYQAFIQPEAEKPKN